MELVPIKIIHGEQRAWASLGRLSPAEVCRNASVTPDREAGAYRIRSFGIDFTVSPSGRRISADAPEAELFLGRLSDLFRLSILWYLVNAKDIPPTGRLVRPVDVRGGQRFFAGTHMLPLGRIAEKFGRDKEGFFRRGRELGSIEAEYGDASLRIYPLPRVPVTVILWLEDPEFPARVDLLLDSTCDFQIPLSDIVWSTALMTTMALLSE